MLSADSQREARRTKVFEPHVARPKSSRPHRTVLTVEPLIAVRIVLGEQVARVSGTDVDSDAGVIRAGVLDFVAYDNRACQGRHAAGVLHEDPIRSHPRYRVIADRCVRDRSGSKILVELDAPERALAQ